MVPYLSVPVFPHHSYQALNRSLLNKQLTLTHILYFCCTCTYCHPLSMGLYLIYSFLFSSVQSLSRVRLFATLWTAARQASLSTTNSRSLLKLTPIESVMPSNHLILCRPLLPPSVLPSIRVFSNESVLHITWPKYWSFSFNISPSNEYHD